MLRWGVFSAAAHDRTRERPVSRAIFSCPWPAPGVRIEPSWDTLGYARHRQSHRGASTTSSVGARRGGAARRLPGAADGVPHERGVVAHRRGGLSRRGRGGARLRRAVRARTQTVSPSAARASRACRNIRERAGRMDLLLFQARGLLVGTARAWDAEPSAEHGRALAAAKVSPATTRWPSPKKRCAWSAARRWTGRRPSNATTETCAAACTTRRKTTPRWRFSRGRRWTAVSARAASTRGGRPRPSPRTWPRRPGVDLGVVRRLRREAAVGAGDDVLAADELGVADDALGDQLGVLDDVAGVGDDAGDSILPAGSLTRLPDVVLVLVARVGGLEGERAGVDLQDAGPRMSFSGASWTRGPSLMP